MVNLYLLTNPNGDIWNAYYTAVVAAMTEDEARKISPSGENESWQNEWFLEQEWTTPDQVIVTLIGVAAPDIVAGTLLSASYNNA